MSALTPPAAEGMGSRALMALQRAGLEIELVRCLDDNYCPVIHEAASKTTIVVDTPEAGPILTALRARGWTPTHILNTHHHHDHVGGNMELKENFPSVHIIGPERHVYKYPGSSGAQVEEIPGLSRTVREGDGLHCGGLSCQVIEVGGHTDGHIAFYFPEVPMVMAGDALFTLGCGRVFTGDFHRMQASLEKLRALPDETVIFSGHEYTTSNAKFALQVEPNNVALQERAAQVAALREAGEPTVPSLMGHEKATNPFLRWDTPEIQAATGHSDPPAVFTAVRRWKDTGKRPDHRGARASKL